MSWEDVTDGTEISILVEIKELLDRHGRKGYLRKRTEQRCRCLDPVTEEADVECPTCSATGYVYLDHKVQIFRHIVTRTVAGAYRKDNSPFGIIGVDEAIFYIAATTNLRPSIHDWVVEVVTGTDGEVVRPPKIERIYDVNDVVDYREDHGQVAFWGLRCRTLALGK